VLHLKGNFPLDQRSCLLVEIHQFPNIFLPSGYRAGTSQSERANFLVYFAAWLWIPQHVKLLRRWWDFPINLESTQPLREMATRKLLEGKGCPTGTQNWQLKCHLRDDFTKKGASKFHNPMGPHGLLHG
jgi:hypothetical protein